MVSNFVGRLTPDTRLFAGAVVAIIAVNVVRRPAVVSMVVVKSGCPLTELHWSQVVAAYIVSAFAETPGPAPKDD